MGWFDAALGGLAGLATGGPLGAAAGVAGGLFGNNDARTEQGVNLQPLTPEEAAAQKAALEKVTALAGQLGMGTDPATLQKLYSAMYNPAASAINESFTRAGSAQDAAALRRGTGPSSRMQEGVIRRQGEQARALADASAQATLGAQQIGLSRDASATSGISALSGLLGSQNASRIAGSTQFSRQPGAGITEGLAGLGKSLTDDESWWNKGGSAAIGNLFQKAYGSLRGTGGV